MALIYIVEDDDSIREIEEFALKNAGHKTLGFACAKDFYKKLEEVIPDLCLVDIMLPDENGNEIVRRLRKDSRTQKLPVIMVTAKTTELDLVKGIEDGADDYIKKPFSVMELISRVKALLRRTKTSEIKEINLDELVINNEKHKAMTKGKRNVTSGLVSWQKPMMKLMPLFPQKPMLDFVYNQQIAGSAKK